MAIAAPSQPAPALPATPPTDDLELAFHGLQGIRDDLAGFLADPFYEPLRAGLDGQLARIYRALTAPDRIGRTQLRAITPGSWATRPDYDAPAGAGDDVESYRG